MFYKLYYICQKKKKKQLIKQKAIFITESINLYFNINEFKISTNEGLSFADRGKFPNHVALSHVPPHGK
jgi:hypothetical protein